MILGVTREVTVLNELLGQTVGSIDRYCTAAGAEISPRLHGALTDRIAERHRLVGQLRHEIVQLGGVPRAERPAGRTAGRPAAGDDASVLSDLDREEGRLLHKFGEALGQGGLSPAVLMTVARCYAGIRAAQDQIRRLRHPVETAV